MNCFALAARALERIPVTSNQRWGRGRAAGGGQTAAPQTPTPTLPLSGGGSTPSLPLALTTSHRNLL